LHGVPENILEAIDDAIAVGTIIFLAAIGITDVPVRSLPLGLGGRGVAELEVQIFAGAENVDPFETVTGPGMAKKVKTWLSP
jgi:hypothetical protein